MSSHSLAATRGIIIGHSNMDLDCLASLALARHLHPGLTAVRSTRINPMARNLYNMYQDHLGFSQLSELDLGALEEIVIVDTRSGQQVREVMEHLPDFSGRLTVYDHHGPVADGDALAIRHSGPLQGLHRPLGANASLLAILLMDQGCSLGVEDATIALAGIYADTGNFSHENVTPDDFTAARWLLQQGASLPLVKKFASSVYDHELMAIMHELVVCMETISLNGQLVMIGQVSLEHQPAGLAMLAERIFDLEHADAIFCVFALKKEKSHLIIARSSGNGVDVALLLAPFGGGGHSQSASALMKKSQDVPVLAHLKHSLQLRLKPGLCATELMSSPPDCLTQDMSLMAASLELESKSHSGAPVVDQDGRLCGMLSLKDIQKGRKSAKMDTPVKAWMSRELKILSPASSLREIEDIFFQTELNRLPVVDGDKLVGLVCRSDYLALVRRGGL